MTEESYQQARKIMQKANYCRGMITNAKGKVAMFTKMEMSFRSNLKQAQADGSRKSLEKWMGILKERRDKFTALKFPESDLPAPRKETVQCEGCGAPIAKGNTYCGECLCEDDCE